MKVYNMYFGASAELFKRASVLRKSMTETEKILWEELKGKKINGLKFRRQHPISKFILDFYCHKCKLGIELDGQIHDEKARKFYDEDRTKILNSFGITVIRFNNLEVINNIEKVLNEIMEYVGRSSPDSRHRR